MGSPLYCLLLFILNLSQGYYTTITEPSIVTFQGYSRGIGINNTYFRESACYFSPDCLFSINLRPGIYHTSERPIQIKAGSAVCGVRDFSDHIIRPQEERVMDQIEITTLSDTETDSKWLTISAFISWLPFPGNDETYEPEVWLEVNRKKYSLRKTRVYHFFREIRAIPGTNYITLKAKANGNGTWCSCPSIGNGYVLSHRLCGWYSTNKESLQLSQPENSDVIIINQKTTNANCDTISPQGKYQSYNEYTSDIDVVQKYLTDNSHDKTEMQDVTFDMLPSFLSSKLDFFTHNTDTIKQWLLDFL
jgi:hypothetical protein